MSSSQKFSKPVPAVDYDESFAEYLTSEIFATAAEACRRSGSFTPRTLEMTAALANVLALSLALSPCAQSPAALRDEIAGLATRLLRLTREAMADPNLKHLLEMVFHGTDAGGHA